MRKILIVGATSAIAEATARLFARQGDCLFLVARDEARLVAVAENLRVRGATEVGQATLDLCETDRHEQVVAEAVQFLEGLETVLIAHGTLSDQKACEASWQRTRQELEINLLSTLSLLTILANRFEVQGYGALAVISSVAGDRGRQSNYIYGTGKGALNIFLQGLRNRLHRSGVRVLTIKPGFVDTPMTAGIPKGALWATPERVAHTIKNAIERKRDVIYVPWFWRWIMGIIRTIPETVFKRLSF